MDSFLAAFPHAILWFLGGHFLIIPKGDRDSRAPRSHQRLCDRAIVNAEFNFFLINSTDLKIIAFIYLFIYLILFLGPLLQHIEVPSLGVESDLQLPAYTTAHGNSRSLSH